MTTKKLDDLRDDAIYAIDEYASAVMNTTKLRCAHEAAVAEERRLSQKLRNAIGNLHKAQVTTAPAHDDPGLGDNVT